jgi:pyruvate,water dikinase
MRSQIERFDREQIGLLSEKELLRAIERLYQLVQQTAYYDIVTPLLMMLYNRILQGQLERSGLVMEQLDLTRGLEELEQLQPHTHLARLNQQYRQLDEAPRRVIREGDYEIFCQLHGIEPLQLEVDDFLRRFGHLSDSGNDFSARPWRETPDLVLEMMVDFKPPRVASTGQVAFDELELSSWRRLILKPVYQRARSFRYLREAVSSLYTYGYGLFRDYFLALGDHFAQSGILTDREDIFYLTYDEVRELAAQGVAARAARQLVAERKQDIERVGDVIPPSTLFGEEALPLEAPDATRLSGIPTSRGQYTGPVKVVRGLGDFSKLRERDVLVIPYSDVSWTPLFAKAGAVVAEAGGILSHSSIVAREYGLPAVVSVPGACQIADDTVVTVDGFRGQVLIHQPNESNADSDH